jgi:hypothetical protein
VGAAFELVGPPVVVASAPFPGPVNVFACTGVMGVDGGGGLAGRSASDGAGALAVEFFLFGRCRHVSRILYHYRKKSQRGPTLRDSSLPFFFGFALFGSEGVGGACPDCGEDGCVRFAFALPVAGACGGGISLL